MNIIHPSAQDLARMLDARRSGNGWSALCPAHDDHNPSLSIFEKDDGSAGYKCFAGCSFVQVTAALRARGCLPQKTSTNRTHGNSFNARRGDVTATYVYTDADGAPVYRVRRDAEKKFWAERPEGESWREGVAGIKRTLYRLIEVLKATAAGETIFLVEGEKDADNLAHLGLVATTNPFGASAPWEQSFTDSLKGSPIVLLPDNDKPGLDRAFRIASILLSAGFTVLVLNLPGLPPKGDVSDWLAAGGNAENLIELAEQTPVFTEKSIALLPDAGPKDTDDVANTPGEAQLYQWGEPVLFDVFDAPEIPSVLLPGWLGAYSEAVTYAAQTPPGLAVMVALSVIATCLQRKIEVSPETGSEHIEPVNLWIAVALPPGNRKSSVFSAMTFPLSEWETEQYEASKADIAKVGAERLIAEKRMGHLKAEAAKLEEESERSRIASEVAECELKMPPEKFAPKVWIGDVTPERLQGLLVEQGEKISLLSDEGGIFEIMSGLYSDGKVNLDVFLQAHAGQSVRVERGTRQAYLNKPALSFGLTVQPEIIRELGQGNKRRFRGIGALARFLYCFPVSNIGKRDVHRKSHIDATIKQQYKDGINRLLNLPLPAMSQLLTLDDNARSAYLAFSADIESKQGPGGVYDGMTDWTGKLPGAALRIAGLFHAVEQVSTSGLATNVINRRTMAMALDLCELLIAHTVKTFALIGDSTEISDAKFALAWMKTNAQYNEDGLPFIKQSDLLSTSRFKNAKMKDKLAPALNILQERDIVSAICTLPTRKPTLIRYINPALFGDG